jgi:hypothetical protein
MLLIKPGDAGFSEGFYPLAEPGSGWTDYIDADGAVVRDRPADWPGFKLERVQANYTDSGLRLAAVL